MFTAAVAVTAAAARTFCKCQGVALELHWSCIGVALELHWSSDLVAPRPGGAALLARAKADCDTLLHGGCTPNHAGGALYNAEMWFTNEADERTRVTDCFEV